MEEGVRRGVERGLRGGGDERNRGERRGRGENGGREVKRRRKRR